MTTSPSVPGNTGPDVERRIAKVEAVVLPPAPESGRHLGGGDDASDREARRELQAQILRLRDALDLQRNDADAQYARTLELEEQVRRLETELGTARERLAEASMQFAEQQQDMRTRLDSAQRAHDAVLAQLEQALRLPSLLAAVEARNAQEAHIRRLHHELQAAREHGGQLASLLSQLLESSSWSLTRPLRRMTEAMRGRRWREPRIPEVPSSTMIESRPDADSIGPE